MVKGVLLATGANILFGLGFYFAVLLRPLDNMGMFGFRIVVLMPFILLAIFLFHQQHAFRDLWQKIHRNRPLVFVLLLLALNNGAQLWLFLWAPNNNQAIPVSIGYLLLPIVTAALGKVVFKEHFSPLKWAALGFAALGVAVNVALASSISWATFVAAFGYPIYITLRRYFHINTLATLFVELLLCLPFALFYIAQVDLTAVLGENPNLWHFLALLGLVNGTAFILFIVASNMLPVNVLGLLGYFEPLVMLLVSFAIGEVLEAKSYLLMCCLGISIVLLTLESFRKRR